MHFLGLLFSLSPLSFFLSLSLLSLREPNHQFVKDEIDAAIIVKPNRYNK